MDEALDQLESELLIYSRRIENVSRRSELYAELDRAGYLLARTIERLGPSGVSRLADALHLDGSTVTRQVASLVERGFAERVIDPDDGRATIVSLTAAGRSEMTLVGQARTRRIGELVHSWDVDEVRLFTALLGRFNEAMSQPRRPTTTG